MTFSRIQHIQEMLKAEPNDSFLNYALALEYAKLKEVAKAIELIEALLINDENYLGAYYQLGKYYEQTANQQKALSIYKKGQVIAQQKNDKKTLGELNEAIMILED